MRLAFYYPWFPNAWEQNNVKPYSNYVPCLDPPYYDSANPETIRNHIDSMRYGNIDGGIASWWGQGHVTDQNLSKLLAEAKGGPFTWCIYHELESIRKLTVSDIESDLKYIMEKYAGQPNYLRIDGRFVVFVYSLIEEKAEGCSMASRWKQANTTNAFVVLKVFKDYGSCVDQPDSWHQYAPDKPFLICRKGMLGKTYSCTISPGFWKVIEAKPRLARDLDTWRSSIRQMIKSKATFQLVTTFNEHGEGTGVECCRQWQTESDHGAYLDALHSDGK